MAYLIPKIVYGEIVETEIAFTYPPAQDSDEQLDAKDRVAVAISGKRWVVLDSVEVKRRLGFSFLSEAEISALRTFYLSHASRGKPFKYYPDRDLPDYEWFELASGSFQPKRITAVGPNSFIYSLDLEFRRVLASTENGVSVSLLNGQTQPISISGLNFDKTQCRGAFVYYEASRKTDSATRTAAGTLHATYSDASGVWTLTDDGSGLGVTFSILSTGQVQYRTDTLAGANYQSVFQYRVLSVVR